MDTITRKPNRSAFQDRPASSPHHAWELEERRYTSRSRFRVHGVQSRKRERAIMLRQARLFKAATR